ncbi:MAG: glycosyltransferase [Desulfobacula sp.]|uniref:glycosyltransferase family 4 protein n=1 Tax=Desulfobacula sp. TaxID=2593537 RepID=UPI001EBC648D|nr:glycosyltransferase [Desulfobacula sp.]
MKIIHIVLGKANPSRANGVNKVVHSLSCWLHNKGIKTEVWGITTTPFATTPDRPYPLKLFKANMLSFLPPKELINKMEKLSKDTIIHFHGVLIPVFSKIAILSIQLGLPYVITPHSALSHQALQRRSWRKKFYIKLFEKSHLIRSARVQALADNEALDIKKLAYESSITIIPNGIDLPKKSATKEKIYYQTDPPIFGYVGRIEQYQKGLDILLEGFVIYRNNKGIGRLVIVGNGPDMEWMKKKIKYFGLEQSVSVTGPLFNKDLQDIRDTITTVVHPSRWEGIAMALLESFAMGIPAIVSYGTNLADIVSQYNAGWGIPNCDVQGLAEALKLAQVASTEGTINQFSLSAKKLVKEKFSWDYAGNRILKDIYAQVANH